MACPHVAGGMAVFLSLNPEASAAEVYAAMLDNAAEAKINTNNPSDSLWTSSPNLLLQVQNFQSACDPANHTENADWYVRPKASLPKSADLVPSLCEDGRRKPSRRRSCETPTEALTRTRGRCVGAQQRVERMEQLERVLQRLGLRRWLDDPHSHRRHTRGGLWTLLGAAGRHRGVLAGSVPAGVTYLLTLTAWSILKPLRSHSRFAKSNTQRRR